MQSEQIMERHSFRKKEVRLLRNLIESKSDIIVRGISGCGKTVLIRDLLKEMDIDHLRVNCIQCSTKQTVIASLMSGLERKYDLKVKQTSKMSGFMDRVTAINEKLNLKKKPSFSTNPFYVIFDNVEKLEVSGKFLQQFLKIKHNLNLNFSVIFIGLGFKEGLNSELENLPTIVIPPIPDSELLRIIYKLIKDRLKPAEIASFEAYGAQFLLDLIGNFKFIVKSVSILQSIGLRLFRVFIHDSTQQSQYSVLIKNENYRLARKLMLQDPYLNEGDEKVFIERILAAQSSEPNSAMLVGNPSQSIKLPLIPAVILVCCWVGNRNPDSLDKKIFKDYKGKSGRLAKKEKSENIGLKPVKIERLISLSQSIISQNDLLAGTTEQVTFHQTLDFYTQIASLVQSDLLENVSNEIELQRASFISKLDEYTLKQINSFHHLKIYDFLYKKD